MQESEACASGLYLIVRVEVHMPSAPRLRATQGKRRRSCISESEMLRRVAAGAPYAHDEGASQYERNAAALTFDPQTSARTDL